ncbi:MAG: hypothetical protein V1720_06705 [bacterium]
MRKIYFIVLITVILIALAPPLKAQVNINFNIGSQPTWGPTGYDYVEYYYLPDIEVYYYVPQHRFYYFERGNWKYSSNLPNLYSSYDFYNSYKVVVNEHYPWRNHKTYREKYSSYKGRHDQQIIRDSRDSKYFVNKNHPQHNKWIEQQRKDFSNDQKQSNNNKHDKSKGQDNKGSQGNHKK